MLASGSLRSKCWTRDGENRRCLALGLIHEPTSVGKGDAEEAALRLVVVIMANLMPLLC